MKKIAFVLFCFVTFNLVNGQIAYYDALYLRDKYDLSDSTIVLFMDIQQVLMNYYPGKNEDEIDTALLNANPFFQGYFSERAVQDPGRTFNKFKVSSIGGLDVTNFSQGLSLFLIDRAKQELNIAFFDKFKKFCEDNPEIGILFPNTTNSLSNLLAYQYSQMLPVLQEAFNKDLDILPANIMSLLLSEKYYEKLKEFPAFIIILNSLSLLQQIDNFTPPEIIDTLPSIARDSKGNILSQDLYSCLKLTSIFSNALRTDSDNFHDSLRNYWISGRDFSKNILSDSIAFNIFLGLVYQRINGENITFNKQDSSQKQSQLIKLSQLIKNNSNQIMYYKMQFMNLIAQVNKINAVAMNIDELIKIKQRPAKEDIYLYLSTTINLFDFGTQVFTYYLPDNYKTDPYIEIAKNVSSLYINTVSKQYALAMNNAIFILDAISQEIKKENRKDTSNVLNKKIIAGITTYGTLIANIADAESPQEVQAALEAAALPAGSSSFKKNYTHNVALNAYLGVNAGNWPKDKSSSATWNNNFKLTAPIGITWTPFSWGKGGALSIFAPLLDVGAIVNYQLNSDSTEVNQKIYLANIFSPGGYLVYGFGANLPISLGFGGQYGPGLIEMGEDLWNPSWRWNFFLTVDIPIFNLNKGKGILSED